MLINITSAELSIGTSIAKLYCKPLDDHFYLTAGFVDGGIRIFKMTPSTTKNISQTIQAAFLRNYSA